jgi:sugar phosphate isomerase/epimerase
MKFSVFTVSTPEWSPQQAAQMLGAQGWDGVEWRVVDDPGGNETGFWRGNKATWPLTGLEDRLDEISRVTHDAGLRIAGIGSYVGCHDHGTTERVLAATARLGAGRVRITLPGVGADEKYPDVFARAQRDYAWVAQRAKAHGVKALVELHHRTIVASASSALRLVDGLDPDAVGVIHDLGNLLIEGQEDHRWAFEMLGPYLAHIHVKNMAWKPMATAADGTVSWEPCSVPLREGIADVSGYLQTLVHYGYDGWVTSEDFSTAVPLEQRTADNLTLFHTATNR